MKIDEDGMGPRYFLIELEVTSEKPWRPNPAASGLYPHSGLKGGYPLKGGFWHKTELNHLPCNSVAALTFPLLPD
jgi:hypothetical protein